ncbi:MAG: trigger factor [Fimbriimonadaceae bacterium]|nr:trigger factor [Fimbriimonadaceae bacterium]QYK55598.1 MAG: trigger factor [Fimbriimonadaceae bacterium]
MSTAPTAEMKVTREDLNTCTVLLHVVCSPKQVDEGLGKAARGFAQRIKVPGFRPGTAPRSVIERMVDPNDYLNAAVDEAVRASLQQAIEESDLKPDQGPAVQVTKFDKDKLELEYTAKIPLPPVVELADYKGLEANRPKVEVTEKEVQRQIDELRQRKGKVEAVTSRGIQEGDNAVVNIRIGDEDKGRNFVVVAGKTFETLDATIIGMGNEEIKHAKLDFPANFQEKDWAGTSHDAIVTIRSVSAVQAPELDDSFAQSLKADNVEELREKMREGLLSAKQQISQEMVNEQLLDQLVEKSQIQVADNTWEQVGSRRLNEMNAELQRQGRTLEEHAKANDLTVEELVQAQMKEAKLHVLRAVLIERIFRAEEMTISQQDVDRHFLQIASENKVPQEQLRHFAKEYGAQLREEIVFRAMYKQVIEFLNEHAKITDAPA